MGKATPGRAGEAHKQSLGVHSRGRRGFLGWPENALQRVVHAFRTLGRATPLPRPLEAPRGHRRNG